MAVNSGYVQTAGTTLLSGGSLTSRRVLDIDGGEVAGFGTYDSSIDNAGIITPGVFVGDIQTLTITGNFQERATANTNIEIGGINEFDRVLVDGAVTFDGTLNVSLIDSFTPIVGQSFEVMTYGSYTGELDFTGLDIGGGLFFRPEFTGDASTPGSLTLFVEKLAPTANVDIVTTEEDLALTIPVAELLSNDINTEGDPTLTITDVADAVNGTVELDGANVFFTPDADFSGDASFTYSVADSNGATDTATVNVTVTPVNDAPVANDDSDTIAEDTPVTTDVLVNDIDVDDDTILLDSFTQGANGTVSLDENSTPNDTSDDRLIYTPNENFNGTDSYTYTISDGNGGSDTATVNVTVTPVNDDPVANDDSASTNEDKLVTIDVLANDRDLDGDAITISALNLTGTLGTVTENPDGTVSYDPNGAFESLNEGDLASDSFSYTLDDGNGGAATATVNITINGVNDDTPPSELGNGVANTNGFWKQEQHFQFWEGYVPEDTYTGTFGVAFDDIPFGDTLLDALKAKGGGVKVLGRTGTAALLNATSDAVGSGINYVIDESALAISIQEVNEDLTLTEVLTTLNEIDTSDNSRIEAGEVIAAVQNALGGSLDLEDVAQAFDAMNNMPSLEVEDFFTL